MSARQSCTIASRRILLEGGEGRLLVAPTAAWSRLEPDGRGSRDVGFSIRHRGDAVGAHAVSFHPEGDLLRTSVEIDLRMRFGVLILFRCGRDGERPQGEEAWRDGRLLDPDPNPDAARGRFEMTARVDGCCLLLSGSEGEIVIESGVLPTSRRHTDALARAASDTQDCRGMQAAAAQAELARGRETDALEAAGDLVLDLWYTEADKLVKVAFAARGPGLETARIS